MMGKGSSKADNKQNTHDILGIALLICKNPETGKYLAVNEVNNTWWVPGGRVDAPEFFTEGAVRECIQQGGIHCTVKGILRFECSPSAKGFVRIKMIFYGEPIDPKEEPKSFVDKESLGAKYMSLQEILDIKDKWRGDQLYDWARYVEEGGTIYPLQIIKEVNTKSKE